MKTYIKPEVSIEILHTTFNLLAGSGVESGDSVGNEYEETDVTYSRHHSVWDDED